MDRRRLCHASTNEVTAGLVLLTNQCKSDGILINSFGINSIEV